MTACSPLLNLAYFSNLEARIAAIAASAAAGTAADKAAALALLQELTTQIFNDLNVLYSTLESQVTLAALLTPLLTAPTDLSSLVTWAGKVVTFLNQFALPIINLPTEIAALISAVATITTAINNAAALLEGSIIIPSLAIICTLEGA